MHAIDFPTPDPRTFDDTTRPFAEAVASTYAIKRLIGRGGMGMVFLARDRRLDRLVAIKTLPVALAKDPAVRERFLRETRTAAAMAHPNIVQIHGADEVDGHAFFVMSYVDGDSLAAHVRAQGQLEPRTAARYLRDVAAALSHAHKRGIIHRDIKAENILIERAHDRALVTDFGIARLAEATPLTVTGQVLGTVYYVSPEQVSGDVLDARSDIYSLGVVGFLALTGRFPFDAEVASAVLVAHVTKAAPPLSSLEPRVPVALAAIIDRCLRKEPAQRFASADELLNALEEALVEIDRPGGARLPALISDTEAHTIWQRAAQLQASTGVHPRPDAVPRARDAAKDRSRGSGYGIKDVREAANEAGIDERYVDHALIEHGLLPGKVEPFVPVLQRSKPAATPSLVADKPKPRINLWEWTPRLVATDALVEGEVRSRDVERLVNVLRDQTGRFGTTLARTRELAWLHGGPGNRLEVSVVPVDGQTHVRVTHTIWRHAMAAKFVAWLSMAFITGPITGMIVMEMVGEDEIGVMVGVGVALFGAVKLGRLLSRGVAVRAERKVRAISDALARKVRESIG